MKRSPILKLFLCFFLFFLAQLACDIFSPTPTPTPETTGIQVNGETGILPNISWITAKTNLTPLNSSEAILDSINITVGIDIPTCGFSSGIEITTYSEGNLVWEKTGRDKVVLTKLALLGIVELPLSKEITVKPDSRVVVARGDAYIQFDYGILVGTTKSYADGTSYCTFFPDLPDGANYQEDMDNWSPMPDLQIETYSQGSFRIDIPADDEPPVSTPVSTNTIAPSEACKPLSISDLSFNPELFASTGTMVEIYAKADWNTCFRAMRLSIDGIIVYELGQPIFTYVWDTSGFNPGVHIVRLEVASLDDNSWLKPSILESEYTLTALTPTPTPIPLLSETIMLDTSNSAAESSMILANGHEYTLKISGTYNNWDIEYWYYWGVCAGTPDTAPMFPSPGIVNGLAAADAFYLFAFPNGDGAKQLCGIESIPHLHGALEFSNDGGKNYFVPTRSPSGYNESHVYEMTITGKGKPLLIRFWDSIYEDNTGQFKIEIEP